MAARRARTRVDPARAVAFDALCAVDSEDAYLNLALARMLAERGLSGRDAAFATELAHGTARLQGRYDPIVAACVKGGLDGLQPEVLTALRLGCHQLLGMRVPDHAAVGTSVELVRGSAGERPVRMVNAVLRRIASRSWQDWVEEVAPAVGEDPVGHLSVRHSHPRWVVEAFRDALPDDEALVALLEADNAPPTVTLAVRPGLLTVDELSDRADVVPGRWSPYAATLAAGEPASLAAVRAGTAGVQDEGSQLVAIALARGDLAGADRRWWDVCAGPGGKTAVLTGLARQRGAQVFATELQPHRARLVCNALRAYDGGWHVVAADGRHPPWPPECFDRVIVDAPCSGLGALRRRPESRWRRTPHDVAELRPLQEDLLGAAVDGVRPGGLVAYATCSPHLGETRGVVDAVLATRGDVVEEDARRLLPDVCDLGAGPHLQLWPHLHGTDAMFLSILRRRGPDQ